MANVLSLASELKRAGTSIPTANILQGIEDALNSMVQDKLTAAQEQLAQAEARIDAALRSAAESCKDAQEALGKFDAEASLRRAADVKTDVERQARIKAEEIASQESRVRIELQGTLASEQRARQEAETRLNNVTQERDSFERKVKELMTAAERKAPTLQTVLPKAEIKPPSYVVTVTRDSTQRIKSMDLTPK